MTTPPQPGRRLIHWSGDAAWNMSTDQAIAESASAARGKMPAAMPTLRIYTWEQPTLSLGYFQSAADSMPRFNPLARVRRSTGGGAILHDQELTYSLVFPTPVGQHGARNDLYRLVHQAVINVLSTFGVTAMPHRLLGRNETSDTLASPFLCFQRRTEEDLIVSGYKVLGSAQRRVKAAILQHGSLLLRASQHASELPGILDLTSCDLVLSSLVDPLTAEIGRLLGVRFEDGDLSDDECDRAEQIGRNRFSSPIWWSRR